MTKGSRQHRVHSDSPEERARLLRELTENPGAPSLDKLTEFVQVVRLRLFGVARDRERALAERLGAAAQLGQEAAAVGEDDPRGVRLEVRQLLTALRGQETARPDENTPKLLETIDRALQKC